MAVTFQDYYKTLEVPRTASADEIKQGFRKLARLYHPDVAKNKITGEAKFKEINEAYEVLGDPEKRRRYDELGNEWQNNGGNGSNTSEHFHHRTKAPHTETEFEFSGTGFSDFFESFFSGQRAGGRTKENDIFAQQGQDVEADLLVSLEEALNGSLRKVTLRRPGRNGEAERTNTYQVHIPPGVHEGQRIRLAGQGNASTGDAQSGDLFLRVRLARHPYFSVQGANLHYDLNLAPWEAVLGVQTTISTLDGKISLRVPAGTIAGSQLRLRGLGLPRENDSRGDIYATVRIQTPVSVSDEERKLWEQLSQISPFKPRDNL